MPDFNPDDFSCDENEDGHATTQVAIGSKIKSDGKKEYIQFNGPNEFDDETDFKGDGKLSGKHHNDKGTMESLGREGTMFTAH